MDAYNMADLKRLVYPADLPKICKMLELTGSSRDVADPWFTGDFEATYADVLAGCTAILESLQKRGGR
jgi:protein-tyrosine phosphatase